MVALSTGNQRSSRLLSMRSSNALLVLPAGSQVIPPGECITALLTGPIPAQPRRARHALDCEATLVNDEASSAAPTSLPPDSSGRNTASEQPLVLPPREMRVGLLTVSDRASLGVYADDSGPEMARLLEAFGSEPQQCPMKCRPLLPVVVSRQVVPDSVEAIQTAVRTWVDSRSVDLVLTSGGTGFGVRDYTPEAIRPLLHRLALHGSIISCFELFDAILLLFVY